MTCTEGLRVKNTGNVRISFTGVSSTTGASAAACSVAGMDPGAEKVCTFTQPISQGHLEAGAAPVTLSVDGVSASLSPQGAVTVLPTVLTQIIHPAVTQTRSISYTLERIDSLGTITTNETVITVKASLVNTGNVRLRQVAWSPSWGVGAAVWDLGCTLDATGATSPAAAISPTVDVPVGQVLLCSGSFTFTQGIMEEGPVKQLTATVNTKATDALVAIKAPAGAATQVDVPVSIAPRMTVDVLDTGCIKPYRAGALHLLTHARVWRSQTACLR